MKPSELLKKRNEEYNIRYPERTVSDMLRETNAGHEDQTALIYYGKKITYGKLFKMIDKYNKALVSSGVEPGQSISVSSGSLPEPIALFYAANDLDVKFHTILPTATTEQNLEILENNNSNLFLTLDSLHKYTSEAVEQAGIDKRVKTSANTSLPNIIKPIKMIKDIWEGKTYNEIPDNYINLNQFLRNGNGSKVKTVPWYDGKVAAITNSSGTTAFNKGTELTDYGFNSMVVNYREFLPELNRNQTFHSVIPLLYSTGLSNSVNLPLQLGLTTYLEPVFNREAYPDRFMELKPNLSIVPVPHAKALLDRLREEYRKSPNSNRDMLSFVDVYSYGGSAMPIPWEEELTYLLEHFGSSATVGKGYGLSEHNSALTISTERMIGSAGKVLPGVVLGIFDPETGEELDFGQEGQIRASSPGDMAGYFNNPELSEDYFMEDEQGRKWGLTGDIGRLELVDGEVWLYCAGREKDAITIDSKSVLLPKIQEKVFECDLIDECEIITKEYDGKDVPVAHIALKNKNTTVYETLTGLKESFKGQESIEPFAYMIHETLPLLPSNKMDLLKLDSINDQNYLKLEETGSVSCVEFNQKVLKKAI